MFADTRTITAPYNLVRRDNRLAFLAALRAHPNGLHDAIAVRSTEFSVVVSTSDSHAAHAVQFLGNRAKGTKPVKYAQPDAAGTYTVVIRF